MRKMLMCVVLILTCSAWGTPDGDVMFFNGRAPALDLLTHTVHSREPIRWPWQMTESDQARLLREVPDGYLQNASIVRILESLHGHLVSHPQAADFVARFSIVLDALSRVSSPTGTGTFVFEGRYRNHLESMMSIILLQQMRALDRAGAHRLIDQVMAIPVTELHHVVHRLIGVAPDLDLDTEVRALICSDLFESSAYGYHTTRF